NTTDPPFVGPGGVVAPGVPGADVFGVLLLEHAAPTMPMTATRATARKANRNLIPFLPSGMPPRTARESLQTRRPSINVTPTVYTAMGSERDWGSWPGRVGWGALREPQPRMRATSRGRMSTPRMTPRAPERAA